MFVNVYYLNLLLFRNHVLQIISNKLKTLKVAKSKDDDGRLGDDSVELDFKLFRGFGDRLTIVLLESL